MNLKLNLPYQGEFNASPKKRYNETIVFVHHFGGSKQTMLRHSTWVAELGFDTVRFDLLFSGPQPGLGIPVTADLKFGARHVWAEQIEAVLNAIPGRKIIYSFSMPSNSALEALARRRAEDVVGWVCDGGPFLDLPRCIWNLYENQFKVPSRLLRGTFTALSLAYFGLGFPEKAPAMLSQLPRRFPILSIRGLADPLVAPSAIESVFKSQSHLRLETLLLENAGHLDGLKSFPRIYKPSVSEFLSRVSSKVSVESRDV